MPKKKEYASTLPASKETVRLVRLYCLIHNLPVHEYLAQLISEELAEFKEKVESMQS